MKYDPGYSRTSTCASHGVIMIVLIEIPIEANVRAGGSTAELRSSP